MRRIILLAGLLISASAMFAQDCSELFFSEYLEGSGNNKGMEIYNPTQDVINLSSYYLARYSNGSNSYIDGGITQLEGFLQSYKTHLIVNGQTSSTETSPAADPNLQAIAQQLDHGYPAPTYMNGNDAIALFKDTGGNGEPADFVLVDLFGIIGGGMPSDGSGWAAFTDEWVYRNVYEGGEIVGQDSTKINNYIVPAGYYWLPWSSNHALVRKRNVTKGVTADRMPTVAFDVTQEWDTIPGGVDVWDSLNAHFCNCEFGTDVALKEITESFSIFPNPAVNTVQIFYDDGINRIRLYDLSGKLVYHSTELNGIRKKQLDVERYGEGLYMVRIRSGNKVLSRKLMIR